MNEKIEKKIIAATCSQSLQNAISAQNFRFDDFELLKIAYEQAPNYDAQIEFCRLILENTTDEHTKNVAGKCIKFEKCKLKDIMTFDENCMFSVSISEKPEWDAANYYAPTYKKALDIVKFYCESGEITPDEKFSFSITKNKIINNVKDFEDCWQGVACYAGNFVLTRVACPYDGESDKLEELFERYIKFPQFLKHFEVVSFNYYPGTTEYGICSGGQDMQDDDDCAYILHLEKDCINEDEIKTKDDFWRMFSGMHTHIKFAKIEVVTPHVFPLDIKKEYYKFMRLVKKFDIKDNEY